MTRWDALRPLVVEARRVPWPHRHWLLVHGTDVMWIDTARQSGRDLLVELAGGLLVAFGCGPVYLRRRSRVLRSGRVGVLRAATASEVDAMREASA